MVFGFCQSFMRISIRCRYEAALQMELELAEDLRNEGYTVTGGH